MNSFLKSMLALSILSAIEVSTANAATAYKIVDKGAVGELENTFTQQKNNNGESVITGTDLYNFPVQYQYLDFDDFDDIYNLAENNNEVVNGLEDLDDYNGLINGNPSANDLSWSILFLQSLSSDFEYQKVGNIFAMINLGTESEIFTVFDEKFDDTNVYTRSTYDYVNGITDDGWVYGNASAPYLPVDFTESDGEETVFWVREFTTRGYFSTDNGATIISLLPPEDTYGGESAIFDISDTNIAVGYASTGIDEDALDYIEDSTGGCADDDVLEDMPFDVCVQEISTGMYNTEAYKWYIDATGAISTEALGHLVTPHEDDERELVSVAQAVNTHGTVAGYSTGWVDENQFDPSKSESSSLYAVIFRNGEVIDLTEDHGEYFNSRAYDINDDGIVVGHVTTYINGSSRTKFYYIDTNSDDMQMIFPDDFFESSSSTARAINESGMIVGEGEYETHNDSTSNPRRKHAFVYDMDINYFADINDLIQCDTDYTVVQARDINDNDEISGTAYLKTEQLDSKGELMFDEDGEQLYEDVLRAVDMIPYDDEIEDCSDTEDKVERQGASFGFLGLSVFALLGLIRRKKHI